MVTLVWPDWIVGRMPHLRGVCGVLHIPGQRPGRANLPNRRSGRVMPEKRLQTGFSLDYAVSGQGDALLLKMVAANVLADRTPGACYEPLAEPGTSHWRTSTDRTACPLSSLTSSPRT